MAYQLASFFIGTLTSTLTTTLYTMPANGAIKEIIVCNTDVAARVLTLEAGTKKIFSAARLEPGETRKESFATALDSGMTIKGGDDAGSVVDIHISGVLEV